MKHIDDYYKDWSGESHTVNSGYPVHDSAEVTDFAQFYHNQITKYESGCIDDSILNKAIETWGVDAQCEMVIEECIELALALQKMKRTRGNVQDKLNAVIDEIADVKIMITQAQKIFNQNAINERVDFKMKRLEERINEKIC
jgi:NTP pyrophosphatase (non-canonical NTP hydrolase)